MYGTEVSSTENNLWQFPISALPQPRQMNARQQEIQNSWGIIPNMNLNAKKNIHNTQKIQRQLSPYNYNKEGEITTATATATNNTEASSLFVWRSL